MTDRKEVNTALFKLQDELRDLKSAKQQIDQVLKISNNVIEGVSSIKEEYSAYLSSLNKDYEIKIKLLDKVIKEIKDNNVTFNKSLQAKTENSLQKQKEIYESAQKELIISTKKLMEGIIEDLKDANENTKQIYIEQNAKINEHLSFYNNFIIKVEDLVSIIDKINFPNRLDKIDTSINVINLGIQNNQTSISQLNQALNNQSSNIQNDINKLKNKSTEITKNINLSTIIIGVNVIISIILAIKLFL